METTNTNPMNTTAGTTGSTPNPSAAAVGAKVSEASKQGAATVERFGETAQEAVGKAAHATASAVRHAGERGEELSRQWMETQEAWAESTRECVREHPITSVAIAFGIGLLLSRLTSR